MNQLSIYTLKALRKLYAKVFHVQPLPRPVCEQDPDVASRIIYEKLMNDQPCMIARFGAFELSTVVNYLGVKQQHINVWQYINGKSLPWWWNDSLLNLLHSNAGFFPLTEKKIEQFCELMLTDMKDVDVLGGWLPEENYFVSKLANAEKIRLMYLDPFWSNNPWTKALKGKKILVVHPFAQTIEFQYKKRQLLFENNDILPEFKSLQVLKAVQSLGKSEDRFNDWFEALNYMKSEIYKCDFDICLIGCGAYGFPLAAHVKRMGKKAVHMGGSLQLLFGIMGSRWDHDEPHFFQGTFIYYAGLENEHWVRPGSNERPSSFHKVESGCYW